MKNLICVFALIFVTAFAAAQTTPSAIFYSDLTSGPNIGGQSNAGAFVTIHGKGFGSSQGSSYVTVGGGNAASYQMWSDSAITFQLGSAAKTGNIVVNVAGVISNSVAFTVRAGNIYFVSTSGSDSNAGSYAAPWKTVSKAASAMKAGDIVYLENGYSRPRGGGSSTALALTTSGTTAAPIAIVAYPNSTASIGSTKVTTGVSISGSNWVLAGVTLVGAQTAVATSSVTGIRIAGSNISCPNGYGTGGCISTTNGSSIALLGNQIHDSGSTSSTNLANYQSVRLLGSNSVEIGWNQVLNTYGCNAISFQPNGAAQYGLSVHDNFIQKTRCEAISLSNVNPAQSAVSVYNNIIASSGTGPIPGGTSGGCGYAAIRVGGTSSTPVQVYNNTVYDAGSAGGASAGAIRVQAATNLSNNIFYVVGSEQYVSSDSNVGSITGTNNLFYGAGTPLGVFANSVVADPQFVSASNGNFHVQPASPAIDGGTTVQLASDFDGVLRPQGTAYDIGAYELITSTIPGTSSTSGTLSASPATLSFGTVTTGQSTSSTTVLTNSGTGSVTLAGANSTSSAFQVSGITFPLTLAAGQSTTLTVTFAPTTSGSQTGTIAVTSNATNSPANISVSGTGQTAAPAVSLSPSSLTFASQTVGNTSTAQNVVVTNTGTASLSISSIALTGSDFAMTNGCGSSLAAGASCSISVTFKPTATGTRTGTITLTDNASTTTQQIALSGTGAVATGTLSASASSLSFGSVNVGSSGSQALTIMNTGSASVTISAISTGNTAFTASGVTLPLTIAAGSSASLNMAFAPTAASTYSSTLTITSNATNSTLSVGLSGTGATATVSHQVNVAWSESASSISGFNVYRSTISGSGYTKVNSSLISGMSYVDTAVTAGSTYYYVVTAVDSTGTESSYSVPASTTVPTP